MSNVGKSQVDAGVRVGPPLKNSLKGVREFMDIGKVAKVVEMLYNIATYSDELPPELKAGLSPLTVKAAAEKLLEIGLKVDSGAYGKSSKSSSTPKSSSSKVSPLGAVPEDTEVVVSLKAVK